MDTTLLSQKELDKLAYDAATAFLSERSDLEFVKTFEPKSS